MCDGHRVPLPVIVALVLRGNGVDGLVAWSVQLGKIEKKRKLIMRITIIMILIEIRIIIIIIIKMTIMIT